MIPNLTNQPGIMPNNERRLKMTRKRWILAVVLVALVVSGFSMVAYAGRIFPGGMGPMYRMNMLFDELGLTGDQRIALKKLFKDHRKDIQPLAKGVMIKGRALRELVLAETPDPAAIRQASAELGNAIADAAVQASVLAQEARPILTPEQVNKLKELRQRRQKVFDETLREWQE
jgi:Spy/CpxP family protein refolding chaperone